MSCKTSDDDLRDRQARAIRNGWGFVPRLKIIDAECPYCGVDLAIEYDYEGVYETDEKCPACGKTFDLTIEFAPMYTCAAREE